MMNHMRCESKKGPLKEDIVSPKPPAPPPERVPPTPPAPKPGKDPKPDRK